MAHDVFISYASEDKITADAVCARLESHRIRCWIAPRDVLPSMDYGQALVEAIKQSQLVVLVFSARSNDSAHVKREVERAVSKGIPILPFRIEDVTPSSSLEFFIAGAHWLDALTPPLERHLERLAETVELLLSRAGTPPVVSQEPEPPTREPAAMSPVLKALGAAGRGLLRYGLAALRLAGRLLRYTAADVARRPRPYALAAAGIGAVILIAVLVLVMLPGGGGNGGGDEQAGVVAPASATTTPRPTTTLTTTLRPTSISTGTSTTAATTTPRPTATPSVAAGKPTVAPKTPTSTQGTAVAAGAPAMGQADTFAIVASPSCVAPGGRVEATWTAVDEEPGDLIVLFAAAARDDKNSDYESQVVDTVGGRVVFAAASTPGEYEVRLVRNGTHLAVSNPITVQDGCPSRSTTAEVKGYSITASPTCVAPGGRVEATWTAVDQEPGDLIVLFPAAARNDNWSNYEWQFVRTVGGRVIFPAASTPGEYEVRLVSNGTHLAASNPITVQDGCSSGSAPTQLEGYSITASPTCVAPGGRVEATWTAVDQEAGDVIVLFPAAARNDNWTDYEWQFVNTVGGSVIFPAASTPGEYEARLVRSMSIHLAASQPITVSNDCPQ